MQSSKIIECAKCGRYRNHDSHGLCGSCAAIERMRKNKYKNSVIVCSICGETKPLHAKGLCSRCYRKEYKKNWEKKLVVCKKCGELKKHEAHGLCMSCYLTPEKLTRYRQNRESIKRNLPHTLTSDEWNLILKLNFNSCVYCGKNLTKAVQEHWIPSSRGGGYTFDNIVPACPSCNSRKRSMTGEEYKEILIKEFNYARTDGSSRR